jgi:hypothetical protein
MYFSGNEYTVAIYSLLEINNSIYQFIKAPVNYIYNFHQTKSILLFSIFALFFFIMSLLFGLNTNTQR